MTPERWEELKQILASALALPPPDREKFVLSRASHDPELGRQALSFLASSPGAASLPSSFQAASALLAAEPELNRPPVAAGSHLGPYEIGELIGAGGMGEVYRACDHRLKRDVAIKVLPSSVALAPDRLRRFELEARAAGGLNHPNILAIYDVGVADARPYVVTELLEGETLRARLSSGSLPPRKAIDYAAQVARGLAAAHEKNIVHRDLKPENLFLTRDGRVKILDFGLAKITRPLESSDPGSVTETLGTEPGTILGTVGYMAPEQIRGERADSRSDLFSLGAVLYEMLTGRRAFSRATAAETMTAILTEDPPELSSTGAKIPPGLDRIVRHCLEKIPGERFHSARDLAFDLESLSMSSGETPVRRNSRRLARAAGWLVLAAAAAAIFWSGTRVHPEEPPLTFRRVTFRRGTVSDGRFTPDGGNIVFSASLGGDPMETFFMRLGGRDSRPMGLPLTQIQGVSPTGELAVLKKTSFPRSPEGTLARMPFSGSGSPRDVLEHVRAADWGPDGQLAIVRVVEGADQLEYPIGKVVLRKLRAAIWQVRVSPRGDRIAMHTGAPGSEPEIAVVDLHGKTVTLARSFGVGHPAWSPDGRQVFYSADASPGNSAIYASTLTGKRRTVLANTQELEMFDLSREGIVLACDNLNRQAIVFGDIERGRERDLSWLDGSSLAGLSEDASAVLFSEEGHGRGSHGDAFLRKTNGAPAVRLGDGDPLTISPDGSWVATLAGTPAALTLLPTGAGEARLPHGPPDFEPWDARFTPDSRKIAVYGKSAALGQRVFLMDLDGGNRRLFGPEGARGVPVFSPDGENAVLRAPNGVIQIWPVAGGPAIRSLALQPKDVPIQWSADGTTLYIRDYGTTTPVRIDRYDLATGHRQLWRELVPADAAGLLLFGTAAVTRDGRHYAYTYVENTKSDLYVIEGLQAKLW